MNNKDKEKAINEEIMALFLFVLNYINLKEFKELLRSYKYSRDLLKDKVNRIIAKNTVNGEFKINSRELSLAVKDLEKDLKKIGQDLRKQEDEILNYILYKVYQDNYYKSNGILSKYLINKNDKELKDKNIKESINKKIDNKTIFDRNKTNKEKFITTLKLGIKNNLKKGQSIDKINKSIDDTFERGAFISKRLIENEIAREFNESLIESYKANNIKRIGWNSALETNSCQTCISLDGIEFNIDEAPPIPLHTSCKCWYESVIE